MNMALNEENIEMSAPVSKKSSAANEEIAADPINCEDDGASEDAEAEFCSGASEEISPKAEHVPTSKYENTLYRVYKNEHLYEGLRMASYAIVLLSVYAFVYYFVIFVSQSYLEVIRFALVTGVPFVIVSLMRMLIDAPRPYQVYSFYSVPPKKKCGKSFPSRHVFSVFVIASAISFENLFLGIGLGILGVALGAFRVLLGIHFIKDTVAGAAIGIFSGVVGMLITHMIF